MGHTQLLMRQGSAALQDGQVQAEAVAKPHIRPFVVDEKLQELARENQ